MRILHVFYGRDMAGGASYSMASLVEGLVQRGHEVHALLPRTKRRLLARRLSEAGVICHEATVPWQVWDANEINLTTISKNLLKAGWSIVATPIMELSVWRLIRKHDIDLVHIGGAVVTTGALAARVSKVPIVWHIREFVEEGHGLRYFPWSRFYRALSYSSAVICVSEGLANKIRTYVDPRRVRVIPNGVELHLDSCVRDTAGAPLRVMFAGGINRTKGTFLLMEAVAGLPSTCEVRVDIYGRANAEQRAEFREVRDRLGLTECAVYRGRQSNMSSIYQTHDILVVASTREAFGRVTVEGMLAGCLVIGSDSGATHDILANSRGLLFHPNDAVSLRSALANACAHYSDFDSTRARAFEYANQEFSIDRYVQRNLDIYGSATSGA